MVMDILVLVMSAIMIGAGAWVWYHENRRTKNEEGEKETTDLGSND